MPESLNLHQMGYNAIPFLKGTSPIQFPDIKTIPTTETEINTKN
jgi:hypothetical protein